METKRMGMVIIMIVMLFAMMITPVFAAEVYGQDTTETVKIKRVPMPERTNAPTEPVQPYADRNETEKDYLNRQQQETQSVNPETITEKLKALEKDNSAFQAGLQGKIEALGAQVWNLSMSIENVTKKVNQRVDCLKKTVFDLRRKVLRIEDKVSALEEKTAALGERTDQLEKKTDGFTKKLNFLAGWTVFLSLALVLSIGLGVYILYAIVKANKERPVAKETAEPQKPQNEEQESA